MGVALLYRFRRLFHRTALRRATMWITAVVALLMVTAWITSWYVQPEVRWNSRNKECAVLTFASGGIFVFYRVEDPVLRGYLDRSGWDFGSVPYKRYDDLNRWRPELRTSQGQGVGSTITFTVPLWLPTVAFAAIAAAAAWRLDRFVQRRFARRRAAMNLCPFCRYDRRGLLSPEAPCPECGKTVDHLFAPGQTPKA